MYRYYRAKSKEKVVIINISKEQNILFDLGTFSIHIMNRIGNSFLSKLNYIKLKFLIAVIYELHIFIDIIHLMSSFLWWSITFVVVLIVRPLNKIGNFFIILPKIQKIFLYVSTVSIVSGFILFGINTDFQYY